MHEHHTSDLAILRCKQVTARVGIARSTLYEKINPRSPRYDVSFPKPISLTPSGHSVGWLQHEIDDWIRSRISASRDA